MANKIKIKRGLSAYINNLTLEPGEIAIVLDTRDLKVGNSNGEVAGINAATATALQEAVTINGVNFDGTSNINVIDAGDHIGINNSTISVVDMGNLNSLLTQKRSTMVEAVNEVLNEVQNTNTAVNTLANGVEDSLKQVNDRIDNLSTSAEINVSTLTNALMELDDTKMSVGNESTRLQMINDGENFEIKNGAASVIQVGLNSQTNSIQTTIASLNVSGKADIGSHRQQAFTSNGEKRTGWFYNGGAN